MRLMSVWWFGVVGALAFVSAGCADSGAGGQASFGVGSGGEVCAPRGGCGVGNAGGGGASGNGEGGGSGGGANGAGGGLADLGTGGEVALDVGPDGGGGGMGSGGGDAPVPCPAPYTCNADPLVGAIHYCAEAGALPLPPGCTTDADCAAAGLSEATCVAEEETGLNGCLQTCM